MTIGKRTQGDRLQLNLRIKTIRKEERKAQNSHRGIYVTGLKNDNL